MSDTPRTDERAVAVYADGKTDFVSVGFARGLERELAAMTKERDRLAQELRDANQKLGECWLAVEKRDKMIASLLDYASAIAHGQCPDWIDGEEPIECPDHECIKCWESWVKEQLK